MFEYIMNFFYGPNETNQQIPKTQKTITTETETETENKHQKPDGYKNIHTSQSQSKN